MSLLLLLVVAGVTVSPGGDAAEVGQVKAVPVAVLTRRDGVVVAANGRLLSPAVVSKLLLLLLLVSTSSTVILISLRSMPAILHALLSSSPSFSLLEKVGGKTPTK